MTILERGVQISEEETIFVRFKDKVGIAPSSRSHENLAISDGLFDPDWPGRKLGVSDGGAMKSIGDGEIFISDYLTTSTTVPALIKALDSVDNNEYHRVRKEIRRESARIIAELTGRSIRIMHKDKSVEVFKSPDL